MVALAGSYILLSGDSHRHIYFPQEALTNNRGSIYIAALCHISWWYNNLLSDALGYLIVIRLGMLLLLQHSRTVLRQLASCCWWSWLSVPAPFYYQWRERPHVSFLLRQNFGGDKQVTTHVFCHDKSMLVATINFWPQKYFVATKLLSWQT